MDDFTPITIEKEVEFKPDGRLLLHPSLPPALHGTNPRTLMGKKWWDEHRQKCYAKHDYHCYACGVDKADSLGIPNRLDAHEGYVINEFNCSIKLEHLVALCTVCHAYIHRNRMNVMFDKGQLTEADCWEIVSHGERTLENQGITEQKEVIEYDDDDWDKWHLIIDGKKFYSKFKNRAEWEEYYR